MNIRDWPMNKRLALPDWCFGRRWPINNTGTGTGANPGFDISWCAFPEWIVIWELFISGPGDTVPYASVEMRLGDKLPANDAEFGAYSKLLDCVKCMGGNPSRLVAFNNVGTTLRSLKVPVHTAGQRLVTRHACFGGTITRSQLILVVSSLPTEVPDWLLSGQAKSR